MAIGWSFGKTRLAERAKHLGKDIKQPFKDMANGFRSLGVDAGFYTKAVDVFAEVNANAAAGEGAGEKCSYRQVLLKVLLGLSGSAPGGVKQSLEKKENKYDSITLDNKIIDIRAQKKAFEELKKDPNKDKISDLKSSYESTVKKNTKRDLNGNTYKYDSGKLEKAMEGIFEKTGTKSKSSDKSVDKSGGSGDNDTELKKKIQNEINRLDKEIKSKEKDKNDAEKVRSDFKRAHEDLEISMNVAEGFLSPFSKKTEAAQKRYTERVNKMQSVIEECAPKQGREKAEIKKIEEAGKSVEKALRALITIQGAQVASYRRITEAVIDDWIDLHRLVEKHNSTDPVISERYQKVILLIRRENRTYFLKETMDEKQKMKAVSEDAGDRLTEELDKENISKRGKKLALEKTKEKV